MLAGWLAGAMNRPSGKPVILTFHSLVDPPAMIRLVVAIFTSSSLRGEIIIKPQKQVKGVEGSAQHSFHPHRLHWAEASCAADLLRPGMHRHVVWLSRSSRRACMRSCIICAGQASPHPSAEAKRAAAGNFEEKNIGAWPWDSPREGRNKHFSAFPMPPGGGQ